MGREAPAPVLFPLPLSVLPHRQRRFLPFKHFHISGNMKMLEG
jgi:hypothetical protein